MASRRRGQEVADLGGRTSEQGKDYLIGCNKLQTQQIQIPRLPHRFQINTNTTNTNTIH